MINAINIQQHVNNITTTNLQATVVAMTQMTTLAGQVFFLYPFLFILLTNIYIDYMYRQQQQQQQLTRTTTATDRRQQLPPPNLSQEVFVLFSFPLYSTNGYIQVDTYLDNVNKWWRITMCM